MTPTSLLLALALVVSVAEVGDRFAGRPDPRRPVILIVHGRGFLSRDSTAFRRDALRALREGAFLATGDSLLEDADVRLVWYADLMDVRHHEVRVSTSCDRSSDSSDVGMSPGFIFRTLALVASDLVDASASDSVDGAHDLAADLRFVGDRSARCAAEGRVADALARAHAEGRPVVIVAHSLGALVAWGYLEHRSASSEHDVPDVERLVTLGSPIGNEGLRELLFGDVAQVSLPRGVRSWVNAVNSDDPIASRLLPFDSTSGRVREMRGISDIVTAHVDEDAHDLRTYLRDSSTAKAVVSAWCEAVEARRRIAGCVALSTP